MLKQKHSISTRPRQTNRIYARFLVPTAIASLAFFIVAGVLFAANWSPPGANPPLNNPPGYIFNSPPSQQAGGSFNISGNGTMGSLTVNPGPATVGGSNICVSNGAGGSSNCAAAGFWTQIGNSLYPNTLTWNVGIGTATPLGNLHVKNSGGVAPYADVIMKVGGNTTVPVGGSSAGAIFTGSGTAVNSGHIGFEIPSNDTKDGFFISTDANQDGVVDTVALKIDASGRVGLSTSDLNRSYWYPLEVGDNGSAAIIRIDNQGATHWTGLRLDRDPSGAGTPLEKWFIGMDNSNDRLLIRRGGATDDVVIDSANGNVGIGTTAPGAKLDVNGTVKIGTLASDPAGLLSGSMYYNSGLNKFRCNENSVWKDCDTSSSGTVTGGGTVNKVPKWTPNGTTLGDSQIFDNGTNVGIGTAAPANKLHISSAVSQDGIVINAGTRPQISFQAAGVAKGYVAAAGAAGGYAAGTSADSMIVRAESNMHFITNGQFGASIVQTLLANGNVGIGTTAPSNKLTVAGGLNVEGSFAVGNGLTLSDEIGYKRIQSYESEPLAINPIGNNVGIGTSAPNRLLHLKTASGNAELDIQSAAQNYWAIYHDAVSENLLFWNADAPGDQNALAIDNTGNVGIGTASPSSKLEINGDLEVIGLNTCTATSKKLIADVNGKIICVDDPAGGGPGNGILNYVTKWTGTGSTLGNSQIFDNGSNVGVGTAGPSARLHISDPGSSNYQNALWVMTPNVADGSNSGYIQFGVSNNARRAAYLSFVGSPTAGDEYLAMGFNGVANLFTVRGNGNVGIGITQPSSKLHVVGDVNITGAVRINNNAGTSGYVLTSAAGGANTWTNPATFGAQNLFNRFIDNTGSNMITAGSPTESLTITSGSTITTNFTDIVGPDYILSIDVAPDSINGTQLADTISLDAPLALNGNSVTISSINNPGLTVGNGSTGYIKFGGSTISDAAGNLTIDSDTLFVNVPDTIITPKVQSNNYCDSGGGNCKTAGQIVGGGGGGIASRVSKWTDTGTIGPSLQITDNQASNVSICNNGVCPPSNINIGTPGSLMVGSDFEVGGNAMIDGSLYFYDTSFPAFNNTKIYAQVNKGLVLESEVNIYQLKPVVISASIADQPNGVNRLTVIGGVYATGGYNGPSDIRFKENIRPLGSTIDKLMNINGVRFNWNQSKFPNKGFPAGTQIGLIAQQVEKEFPELISTDGEGYKGIAYDRLVAVLLEAVKEQQQEIDQLKAIITPSSTPAVSAVDEKAQLEARLAVLRAEAAKEPAPQPQTPPTAPQTPPTDQQVTPPPTDTNNQPQVNTNQPPTDQQPAEQPAPKKLNWWQRFVEWVLSLF